MRYVFLALFVLVSVIHLYDSFRDDAAKRKRTKPLLLAFLILFYFFSTKEISVLLTLALVFSWLGDILLIHKGHGWFTAGGISFLLGHIFFILSYVGNVVWDSVLWMVVIPVGILYFFTAFLVIRAVIKTTPKAMIIPMYLYLIANSTMNIFALMQLFSFRSLPAVVAYLGAVFFFISDCTLYLVRYYKDPDLIFKRHFTVMLTYLLGEFLIVLGMLGVA